MSIRNLVVPAGLALALVVGACANASSSPEGSSVGMDKDAKAATCCPELDKVKCEEAKAAGKCEGSKASCEAAKGEQATPKTEP